MWRLAEEGGEGAIIAQLVGGALTCGGGLGALGSGIALSTDLYRFQHDEGSLTDKKGINKSCNYAVNPQTNSYEIHVNSVWYAKDLSRDDDMLAKKYNLSFSTACYAISENDSLGKHDEQVPLCADWCREELGTMWSNFFCTWWYDSQTVNTCFKAVVASWARSRTGDGLIMYALLIWLVFSVGAGKLISSSYDNYPWRAISGSKNKKMFGMDTHVNLATWELQMLYFKCGKASVKIVLDLFQFQKYLKSGQPYFAGLVLLSIYVQKASFVFDNHLSSLKALAWRYEPFNTFVSCQVFMTIRRGAPTNGFLSCMNGQALQAMASGALYVYTLLSPELPRTDIVFACTSAVSVALSLTSVADKEKAKAKLYMVQRDEGTRYIVDVWEEEAKPDESTAQCVISYLGLNCGGVILAYIAGDLMCLIWMMGLWVMVWSIIHTASCYRRSITGRVGRFGGEAEFTKVSNAIVTVTIWICILTKCQHTPFPLMTLSLSSLIYFVCLSSATASIVVWVYQLSLAYSTPATYVALPGES